MRFYKNSLREVLLKTAGKGLAAKPGRISVPSTGASVFATKSKSISFAAVVLRFHLRRCLVLCQATNLIINTLYQFYFSFLLLSRGSAANLSRDVPQKRNKKRATYPITPRLRPPVGGLIKLS